MDFKLIQEAYNVVVEANGIKRVDGEGFSVYRAGSIIRIDIKQESQ